ncbi:hypothetical protein niasHT_020293 [Heterodera trifolii]|uniref:PB1 domain-containing protein n=1 Tax=Heterodera trifolii TaxID=157864 RepID=A0ABD2JQK0_9BILA
MNKTTLKARFGSDIRKNWIHHSNDISLNDLVTKMQRYFDIKDANAIKLKYRDQENDWVTLADDDDLAYALASMELLYVDVIVEKYLFKQEEETIEKTAPSAEVVKAVAPPRDATPVDNGDVAQLQKQLRSSTTPVSSIGELTEIPLNGPVTPPVNVGGMYGQPQQLPQQAPVPQQTSIPPPPVSGGGMFYGQPQQQQPPQHQQQTPFPLPPVSVGGMFYGQQQQPQAPMPQQQQPPHAPMQQQTTVPPVTGGGAFYGQPQQQPPQHQQAPMPPPPVSAGAMFYGQQQQPPQQAPLPQQQAPQQHAPMPPPPVSSGGVFYGQNPFSRQNR